MNDITALSQREKFETWLEEAEALPWGYLKKRRTSDDAYHEPNTTDMWAAWQAASVEMVEALEKAQKSNQFLKDQLSELANFNPDWDKLEASYESWREIAAELLVAKNRIADLESRTVTVKLPLPRRKTADDYVNDTFEPCDLAAIYNACRLECEVKFKNALAAAGIQVIEGEGQ